jgi:hypothetical protein
MSVRKAKKVTMLSLELMRKSTRDSKTNLKNGLRRDA